MIIIFENFEELYTNGKPQGTIETRSKNCYVIRHSSKYYCTCRTYEQAHYVREELTKVNWDKSKLPTIHENYPYYYTLLMEFYRYITQNHHNKYLKWCITIPPTKSDNKKLQQIRCSKVEDALHERDFLVKHNWDYELLVEQIDDTENPYYNVNLPPYPQRKITNLRIRNGHREELEEVIRIIQSNEGGTQKEICKELNLNDMTLRNWLKQYNTNWGEFRKQVLKGLNPLDTMKLERHIYTPDLSIHRKKKGVN